MDIIITLFSQRNRYNLSKRIILNSMALVIWNSSLEIGIPEIDRQHKQLIDQLNLLVDAMHANRGVEEIQGIIRFLDLYVVQHFAFEEGCMHKNKCPVATHNDQAHAKFSTTLREIKMEFQTQGSSLALAIRVNEELLDWFVNHIKKIDKELKAYTKS